ncbi:hypothetical protein BUY60_07530 [Staphylococcus epidermidis]|uniref:hypothetical protein n=2 Tax=Staphylococcus epidermidis TaxID=1282 RepID=UPI000D1C342A|nr:hypothetical protein [Staphylococcus epidermidis]PTE92428.1 hypothetical protein BUY68_02500 [Staphylococcus epidermidis]PTE97291.1 hypothetical protein BUY63_06400 [Staphylococcus epidermidis]PTF50437.1 hypothetical protein BUY60_07530 [Staphylococcus epidermidis]
MKEFKAIIVILSLIPFEFLGVFTDYQTGLLLGYFPFVIIAILISFSIFKSGVKSNISVVLARIVGILVSWICVHLFVDIDKTSGYFKPFTTDVFSIILGGVHVIVITLICLVMYSFSYRNK